MSFVFSSFHRNRLLEYLIRLWTCSPNFDVYANCIQFYSTSRSVSVLFVSSKTNNARYYARCYALFLPFYYSLPFSDPRCIRIAGKGIRNEDNTMNRYSFNRIMLCMWAGSQLLVYSTVCWLSVQYIFFETEYFTETFSTQGLHISHALILWYLGMRKYILSWYVPCWIMCTCFELGINLERGLRIPINFSTIHYKDTPSEIQQNITRAKLRILALLYIQFFL